MGGAAMADDRQDTSLDARRLSLEERKWNDEISIRKTELEMKQNDGGWIAKFSPLTATLIAGIVTAAGTIIVTNIQNSRNMELEQEKSKQTQKLESQKEQHELIMKMISVGNATQAGENLAFIADLGLVDDETANKIRNRKSTGVLPSAAAAPSGGTSTPTTAEDLRKLISDEAIQLIQGFEAPTQEAYEAKYSHPAYRGGLTGIQMGIDYDLGFVTADDLASDWKSYLAKSDIDLLKSAVGIVGPAAQARQKDFSGVSVSWQSALTVFYGSTLLRVCQTLDRSLPNTKELPPDSYGALVSLVYNRHAVFDKQGDRYAEMRKIRELMAARQFTDIPAQIRAMKRLWPDSQALQMRREREAKLFQQGLEH
jgi:GH24 family phage-related lysozyme (muramidase)